MTDDRPRTEDAELALAIFLGRPGRVLNSGDYQDNQVERMRTAIDAVVDLDSMDARRRREAQAAVVDLAYERGYAAHEHLTTPGRGLGELLTEHTPTPPDLRIDVDNRVDAAYQRGFAAGRATVQTTDLPAAELDNGELYAEQVATLRAQRRHAEVAAEAVLENSDGAQRLTGMMGDEHRENETDRARRRELDAVARAYTVTRDSLFLEMKHTKLLIDGGRVSTFPREREDIAERAEWWADQLRAALPADAPQHPIAAAFADRLVGVIRSLPEVEGITLARGDRTLGVELTDPYQGLSAFVSVSVTGPAGEPTGS